MPVAAREHAAAAERSKRRAPAIKALSLAPAERAANFIAGGFLFLPPPAAKYKFEESDVIGFPLGVDGSGWLGRAAH